MSSNSECILSASGRAKARPPGLFTSDATRLLEAKVVTPEGHPTLMQLAGLALARLALAVAPHAQNYWIACGPGNNGGDGFAAAYWLQQWGKTPLVSYLDNPAQPPDASAARQRAQTMGVSISAAMPEQFDACIDCLFGTGALRTFNVVHHQWMDAINQTVAPVLSADVPSGLNADTGTTQGLYVKADYTLSLLTLKPGLFTGDGRQAGGEIWFNNLGVDCTATPAAQLITAPNVSVRAHNTHKGSFGDVAIVGGANGMTGAAILAASAALHGGAGRVFVGLLQSDAPAWDSAHPELMFRPPAELALEKMVVVAGCGGGHAIAAWLESLCRRSSRLVLDADALNHLATDVGLQQWVRERPSASTVLTPHPLEAARLLGCSTREVQSDRLNAAQTLAGQFNATVVLKGSGTIVAAPDQIPKINSSANALLATGGTGDVLAGLIGANLAAGHGDMPAACEAVYRHGAVADQWRSNHAVALTASRLSDWL